MNNKVELQKLVEHFDANIDFYKDTKKAYNEHSCRIEFIDPFLKATPHNKAKRTVLPAGGFWQNGLRLEFSQKVYGFKPPGRACQPEADSLTRI